MKKLIVLLLFTITALSILVSACGPDKPGDTTDPKAEPPKTVNYTATITETPALKYFIPQAMTPAGTFFGMSGSKITVWNSETGQVKTLGNAWEAKLSPDGKKIAFTDEKGLHVMELDTGQVKDISGPAEGEGLPSSPSTPSLGVWSEDSGRFLFMYLFEWTSDYFIYNLETGENLQLVFKEIPNFLSSPVDWLGDKMMFIVHASESRDGKREYRESGYRSNLVLSDDNGSATLLTDLDDGNFVIYGGTSGDKSTTLILIRNENGKTSAGLLETSSGNIKTLPVEGDIATCSISPNGNFAVFVIMPGDGQMKIRLLELQGMEIIVEEEIPGSEPPRKFIWEDDSSAVYFGTREENGNSSIYTVNIN